jgi:hypothetical protein
MPQEQSDHTRLPIRVDGPPQSNLGLVQTHGGLVPHSIRTIKVLGRGRAAEARLVSATLQGGEERLCVEKVFRPGLLTRAIYRIAFQAPFAYQTCEHAILASFYRRRVAGAIALAMKASARVAEPYYVRWDAKTQSFVLACEYIRGRGILPQPLDSHSMRRWLASWVRQHDRFPAPASEEIRDLMARMTKLESLFRGCGLEGTGWQVCTRAMVSTANLLRAHDGYVVVDLESGIPAILVPSYVMGGLRIGALPPFDDLDRNRLRQWLADSGDQLVQELGRSRYELLAGDVERLIGHMQAWKKSELALARNKWFVFSRACREHFKARCVELWRRREIIDDAARRAIEPGRRIFSRATFLLGLIPGRAGRFLQRLWANRTYRVHVRRFFGDAPYRRAHLREFVSDCTERWRAAGRIATTRQFNGFDVPFMLNGLLAATTPASMHRSFSDSSHRRNVLIRMWLICVSARFQSEYGRYLIRSWLRQWEESGRITPLEAIQLRRQLSASDMDEYVRCFGMHMGLKLLLPLLTPLKYGGGAVSIMSGNLWFLFFLLLMPACRTAITLWRMLASKRPFTDYLDALVVGALPVIGSIAYPVQIYSRYRELSAFLLRDSAARLGRWVPVYGGKDSRVEIGAIRLMNLVAECLEIGLAGTAPLRRHLAPDAEPAIEPHTIEFSSGRWNKLASEQLRLIVETEAASHLPADPAAADREARAA